jgi:anaerobic ribonucleoside-triphosphate reductase activating protein
VNGPGLRSVVWVQGCSIHCPGCLNRRTHPHRARLLVNPRELARQLLRVDEANGLTISGGEPFEQAEACSELAAAYRASGRTVMAYSGYSFDVLLAAPTVVVKRFLAQIDLLIAGPYVRAQRCAGELWRGSTNQTVHFLTDRLKHAVPTGREAEPVVEISSDGLSVACTGFPESADLLWVRRLAGLAEERSCASAQAPQ